MLLRLCCYQGYQSYQSALLSMFMLTLQVCLALVSSLFYNFLASSDCIASNVRKIDCRRIGKCLERSGCKLILVLFLIALWKTTKYPSENIPCSAQGSNRTPSVCKPTDIQLFSMRCALSQYIPVDIAIVKV
jgi:hypothetical protein